jgi:hypothetical protein
MIQSSRPDGPHRRSNVMSNSKPILVALATAAAALVAACADDVRSPSAMVERPDVPLVPGSERDAHGCVPSAGYRWCERTQQCERPWELAAAYGFENSQEAFEAFCGSAQ